MNVTFVTKVEISSPCAKSNSSGLQLADLIARPIGLHKLKPEQPNRAYDVIEEKVSWWIKSFP